MNKFNLLNKILIALIIFLIFQEHDGIAQRKKLAQTGMKFLNVSLDARTNGIGDATTSLETNSSAMFYNPASMGWMQGFVDISLGSTQYIADIDYYNASIAFAPYDGDYGVFGLNFLSVNYGDFLGTIRAGNEQGYLDVGTFSPTAISFGLGYAKALSEKFSVGANIKYVRQSLGSSIISDAVYDPIANSVTGITDENERDVIAFDFGLLYKTGFKSLNIGMSVRNFAREIKYEQEGFQLPLIFQIGASMDLADLLEFDKTENSLLLSVDANHPRDYPEQIMVGLEYTFMNLVSLRGGYSAPNDERDIVAGIGIKKDLGGFNLAVDYSYTPFGIFENVHRLSVNFRY